MKQAAVVGYAGAVGQAFVHYARTGGLEVLGLEQGDADKLRRLQATDAPVLVCTRAEHLYPLLVEEQLNQLDPARLIFVQNGMIEDILRQCHLDPEAVGRGVLYISITQGKV
ncbi:MAG: hypothetical protein HY335_00010, partial [Deinococcus sp.]|nr:hypothetical protein [Deinococcus sp.]